MRVVTDAGITAQMEQLLMLEMIRVGHHPMVKKITATHADVVVAAEENVNSSSS